MASPLDNEKLPPSGNQTKLPALGIPSLTPEFQSRVKEILEILLGRRGGSKWDMVVTFRDLYNQGLNPNSGAYALGAGAGSTTIIPGDTPSAGLISQLEVALRQSAAFKELQRKIGSAEDLAIFPEEIRSQLAQALDQVARQRQADIQQLDQKIQTADSSMASRLVEVTAALTATSAGVRHLDAAFTNRSTAIATSVTQVTARLDDIGGVTLEEKFIAQADVNTGLLGQWSVKIVAGTDANPVIAGIALSVEVPEAGPGTSSFVILADKFGVFTSGGALNPFSVSGSEVIINGTLKVNGTGGPTLGTLTDSMINNVGDFASAPTAASYRVNDVYKNTTDGNTYILALVSTVKTWVLWLAKGAPGGAGSTGARGTVQIVGTGYSSWSDSSANAEIASQIGGGPTNRDMVTLTNGSSFSQTKFYSSGSWLTMVAFFGGNVLVNGTLSCAALIADTMVGQTYKTANSGGRVTINESGNNAVQIYNSAGTVTATLGGGTGNITSAAFSSVPGVRGTCASSSTYAVLGDATAGTGVAGLSSSSGAAVVADNSSSGDGLTASSSSGYGIRITGGSSGIVQTGGGVNYFNSLNPNVDGAASLGTSGSFRWSALYANSSTITTSDARTKKNVVVSDLGLEFINTLRPVKYQQRVAESIVTERPGKPTKKNRHPDPIRTIKKRAGTRYHYGLIAQEVRAAALKHGVDDAAFWSLSDPADEQSQQALRYEELISPLIKAVQELSAEVVDLREQVRLLKMNK